MNYRLGIGIRNRSSDTKKMSWYSDIPTRIIKFSSLALLDMLELQQHYTSEVHE